MGVAAAPIPVRKAASRKSTRWFWLLLPCLVALVIALTLPWLIPDPITPATFEKVQRGMTKSEVQAILGTPWGMVEHDNIWIGDRYVIIVYFDYGLVTDKHIGSPSLLHAKPGVMARLRRLLRL